MDKFITKTGVFDFFDFISVQSHPIYHLHVWPNVNMFIYDHMCKHAFIKKNIYDNLLCQKYICL